MSDGALDTSTSALVVPSSPDRMSLMMIYFPNEVDEHGTFSEIKDIGNGVVPHDEHIDEMLTISMSQVDGQFSPSLLRHSIFSRCPPSRSLRRSRLLLIWRFQMIL